MESIISGIRPAIVAIEGEGMDKTMDAAKAAKILKRGSRMVAEDAKEFCDAYDYAVANLADTFLIESICADYMNNKISAPKAMILIIQLVRNGRT